MDFIEIKKNNWALKGNLTFENISIIIDRVKGYNWSESITLDLSGAEDVDTSLLSLIFEWKRQAKLNKQNISIKGIPHNLIKLAKLYGAEEFILNKK